jgi:hypothetical protein
MRSAAPLNDKKFANPEKILDFLRAMDHSPFSSEGKRPLRRRPNLPNKAVTKKKENPARPGRKGRGEPEASIGITGGKSLIDRYKKRRKELKLSHPKMLEHLLDAEAKQ